MDELLACEGCELILVTGGAGFIGSNLVSELLKLGNRVRVLDNLSSGKRENLQNTDVDLVVGDICHWEDVKRAVAGVERVFHLAAAISVQESLVDPLLYFDINLTGSVNVLEASRQAEVRTVVLASSAAVYGSAEGTLSEDQEAEPLSPYAASKLGMEGIASFYRQAYGLETISLRFFNVYGPRQSLDSQYAAVIPRFIQAMLANKSPVIYGDGNQSRDFVYIQDVIQACIQAINNEVYSENAINIAYGKSTSVNRLASILHQILPEAPLPIHTKAREGEVYQSEAAIDRARAALGYRPDIALQEGLDSTVEWFRILKENTDP